MTVLMFRQHVMFDVTCDVACDDNVTSTWLPCQDAPQCILHPRILFAKPFLRIKEKQYFKDKDYKKWKHIFGTGHYL